MAGREYDVHEEFMARLGEGRVLKLPFVSVPCAKLLFSGELTRKVRRESMKSSVYLHGRGA